MFTMCVPCTVLNDDGVPERFFCHSCVPICREFDACKGRVQDTKLLLILLIISDILFEQQTNRKREVR